MSKRSIMKESQVLTCIGDMIRHYCLLVNICNSSVGRNHYMEYIDTLETALSAIDENITVRYKVEGRYIVEFCYMYDYGRYKEPFGDPWKVGSK